LLADVRSTIADVVPLLRRALREAPADRASQP